MSPNEKVELKLRNIVDSGKPKTITIDGKKFTSQKTKSEISKIKKLKMEDFFLSFP